MPDRLAPVRQDFHLDLPPMPVVDQVFQRFAEHVKVHLVHALDEFISVAQLHGVMVAGTVIEHRNAALEFLRGDREADRGWRLDDVVGQRVDPGEIPGLGIRQEVGDAPETIGSGQLLQLMNEFLQLRATQFRGRQLGRC